MLQKIEFADAPDKSGVANTRRPGNRRSLPDSSGETAYAKRMHFVKFILQVEMAEGNL